MFKNFLKNYGTPAKIFAGFAVVSSLVVAGYFGYKYTQPKPTKVTSVKPTTNTTTQPKKVNFDGQYSGKNTVANGISQADVSVNGGTVSGTASYNGVGSILIPLKVTGTIQRGETKDRKDGNIQCNFSGSSTYMGQKVTVSGVCSGHIITTSMNVSYSATAVVLGQSQTYPGQITLSKK